MLRIVDFGKRNIRFTGLVVVFLLLSLASWGQQVTTIGLNRNDAACYLTLARNLVAHGTYSLDQSSPFRLHTEWPPGVPLLYTPIMAVVGDFPLSPVGVALVHCWSLLLALGSLWCLWRYLNRVTSTNIATAVTALCAATHAFLDSSNAATADALAVGVAFLALYEVESYFAARSATKWASWRVHLLLAMIPIVKPYLGMIFVVYLWRLWQTRQSMQQIRNGIIKIGCCCLPFAVFIAYSITVAQQSGDISAITWLTTDNATAVQAGVATTDTKTFGEWVSGGLKTLRYYLIYHMTDAAFPPLYWVGFADWPAFARLAVFGVSFALMGLGASRLIVRQQSATVIYALAILSFFIVFACDSARYFTVLTPICGLMAIEGIVVVTRLLTLHLSVVVEHRVQKLITTGALSCAMLAGFFWSGHRWPHAVDPDPFYREVYAAFHEARNDPEVTAMVVPYQLRSVAQVEVGKPIFSYESVLRQKKKSGDAAHKFAVLVIKHDPAQRIRPSVDLVREYGALKPINADKKSRFVEVVRLWP